MNIPPSGPQGARRSRLPVACVQVVKADKLREMGFDVSASGTRPDVTRPDVGTEDLTVNREFLDEQFVNQLIAGDDFDVSHPGS